MSEFLVTLLTLVLFVTSMDAHVGIQMAELFESFVAVVADEWSLVGVRAEVVLQAGFLCSLVVTLGAMVRLASLMHCPDMSSETLLFCKPRLTLTALVRFLPWVGVFADVVLQVLCMRSLVVTSGATVRLVPLVH